MTTLLDAHALVGYLAGEPCADEVAGMITGGAAVSALNVAETIDRVARVHGLSVDRQIDDLRATGLAVHPVDEAIGRHAGRLRADRYDPKVMAVSMADCVAAATALELDLPLATSDAPLATLLAAEGGRVVPLPDSRGVRPG